MATDDWNMAGWRDQRYREWRDELQVRRDQGDSIGEPDLQGARVRLRLLEPGDELRLYEWAGSEYDLRDWREESGVARYDKFRERLRSALVANAPHFVVEGLHSGRMAGWVYADQLSQERHRCRMHVYVIPEARVYGAGAEAGILFLDHLFGWGGMRKVIVETLIAQERSWRMAEHWGFQVEGVFRDEWLLGGRYHDVARLAIRRDDWRRTLVEAPATVVPAPSDGASLLRRALQTKGIFSPTPDEPQYL